MTDAVHEHGSLAAIQLVHNGSHAANLYSRETALAPSHTVVDWGEGKVESGSVDSVLVEYDTDKVGLINRIVTFNSNSRNSPHAFYLIGNVMPKDSLEAENLAEDGL